MLARVRHRLSYANVVATLALFVALGGTGYAASQLTGRDIKNRSLTRVDIKKNALTGTEINESKLRQVPKAKLAQNSINANSALAADVSKNSQSADTATVAGIANDARALAGQGVGSFEKSSRTSFGVASSEPAGVSGETVLLSWPEMGVEVTSANAGAAAAAGASCGGSTPAIAVRNTKSSGPSALVFESGGSGPAVAPGGKGYDCLDGFAFDGQVTDATNRTLFVNCVAAQGQMRCLGVRSEP
jgi:hypothetical protein